MSVLAVSWHSISSGDPATSSPPPERSLTAQKLPFEEIRLSCLLVTRTGRSGISGTPVLVVCTVLTVTAHRITHQILVPIVLASVLVDTLMFSHSTG